MGFATTLFVLLLKPKPHKVCRTFTLIGEIQRLFAIFNSQRCREALPVFGGSYRNPGYHIAAAFIPYHESAVCIAANLYKNHLCIRKAEVPVARCCPVHHVVDVLVGVVHTVNAFLGKGGMVFILLRAS